MVRRSTAVAIAASMVMAASLAAATAAQDADGSSPESVVWTLTSAGGADVPPIVDANLFMSEGDANGHGGCNAFFTTYELSGDSGISFGDVATTLALCEGIFQEAEDAYIPALGSVAGWSIDGTTLTLSDESGNVLLTFEDEDVIAPSSNGDLASLEATVARQHEHLKELRRDIHDLHIPKYEAATDKNTEAIEALVKRVDAEQVALTELSKHVTNLRDREQDAHQRIRQLEQALLEAGLLEADD